MSVFEYFLSCIQLKNREPPTVIFFFFFLMKKRRKTGSHITHALRLCVHAAECVRVGGEGGGGTEAAKSKVKSNDLFYTGHKVFKVMHLCVYLCTLCLLMYLVFTYVPCVYLCTLCLLACQVRVTVGDWGLCCCVCVTSFER